MPLERRIEEFVLDAVAGLIENPDPQRPEARQLLAVGAASSNGP